jgi:hypothetical protein
VHAKLSQVLGQELGVQKLIAASNQPRDQVDQGNLAGITRRRKHTLAKECPAKGYPIQAADQLPLVPALNAVR